MSLELDIYISSSRVLNIRGGGLRLGSSAVVGAVELREDGLYLDGKLVVFRRALRCPVKIGGLYLCQEPPEIPRFFYRDVIVPGFNVKFRMAELYATDKLNRGECLAEYLYSIVKGAPHLWDIYYRKEPKARSSCGELFNLQIARGLREQKAYRPPLLNKQLASLLGLLRFPEALELVEMSWPGLAVALRYGLYGALSWDLPPSPDMWYLLFGLYSALDPVVVPGGVAVDLGILRALPYVVARVMGRWLVAFNVAGLYMAAGNFNMLVDGGRKRAKYASCDGDKCVAGGLYFNYCVELECGMLRTWDFEFKGPVKCPRLDLPFIAVEPCK